ncbi:MAG: Signal transduction response regulator / Tetratricopeptide repeat-containing protein [Labilithrix sp.]|nr:Signal transduction response regulator / Tetratricopeptide repeat-containing protein [Labilithrix sp.]
MANLLAPALEPLLGREDACEAALSRFREGARVVTLTGAGGMGKSSIAREVGRRVAAGTGLSESGDVILCELADVTGSQALLMTVARAASVATPGSSSRGKSAIEALAKGLAASASASPLMLVLDDADAVVGDAATLVRACLDASDALRFLVTSREALGLEGERVHPVGPLGAAAALELFESRAGAGAAWTKEQVAALVEHLDGLPLGIELAARRSRLVPPSDLLDRLEERFRLLKTDRRDVATRHATLAATIEWSLARLEPDETRAFAALGVFEGSFSVEAFEAVVGPMLAGDALDAAEALLRKSLIATVESQGAARLTMLRTLRAFARERLRAFDASEANERAEIELRHADFYVTRAEQAAARAYGAGAEQALDAIEIDVPNLLGAFEREKERRPELAARIVAAIEDVVVLRSAVDLRSTLFAEARAAADRSGDAALRARTRIVEAKVTLELARATDAEALLVEALAIADAAALDDAADVRRSLAWARIALAQAESALALLDEALVAHRAKRNVRGEADALAARGLTRCLRGELALGHADLENAYALHVLANDAIRREKVIEIATVVGLDLGADDAGTGSVEERIARLRAAADAHKGSGRVWREAVARFRLAALDGESESETSTSTRTTETAWVIGPEARWVRTPRGEEMDLARHGALRRVLDALLTRRLAEPGVATTAIALLASGWPDERVRHESGMLRVYSVIRRLRALGVGDALVTRDDGYLLDPAVPFERAS